MASKQDFSNQTVEADVLESSVIDEDNFRRVLTKAGRIIAQPALEALEIILDKSTPQQVRLSMIAALTYLIVPIDLIPDFIPASGFSDDLVAITAVISLWSNYNTTQIKQKARQKLDLWFPL